MKPLFIVLPVILFFVDDVIPAVKTSTTKSVTAGESVTLYTGVIREPDDLITWYFNDVCIAKIRGFPGEIFTGMFCNTGDARSTNRLKVDQQTGSLTITDTKTSDTGDYKFKISGNNNAVNLFIVVVYSSQPRHHTAAFYFNKVIGLIASYVNVVVVVMLVAGGITACVIYCCHVRPARKEHNDRTQRINQETFVEDSPSHRNETSL